ncbi:MAG: hypothetical protein KL787_08130 [Taibaiella sp.]|nr:hypothetical protein [Taibaiella sp.]
MDPPFFQSWDLHGRFPGILSDQVVGKQAQDVYNDARKHLSDIVKHSSLQAKAVFGIFPAYSTERDEIVIRDSGERFICLRQQSVKTAGQPNFCLSDYIAPQGEIQDYVGCFAVSAGFRPGRHPEAV